ncbi:MAG: IS1182 family transposase, partial [Dehalococcoidales bacterium]|nr:IS1182 family transposase [Dehalococcoidales bacterium]
MYLNHVGNKTFYGFLASMRGKLFKDEEFAEFYCPNNGRDSVPPSMLATTLLLQTHDKVSDEEAKERADFDVWWKVALGIAVDDKPFAKSTLQLFRAHLILHDKVRAVFQRSLRFAKETGYLKGHRMKAALDTSYILGRGAVKDTYNLLADGIVQVARALAALDGVKTQEWAKQRGLERYFGSSVKGEAAINWDDEKARRAFLQNIVADADRVLEVARQAQGRLAGEDQKRQVIVESAELLGQLLLQDVERKDNGANLKEGVSRDRIPSVHDPEMRHGHKSSSVRFDGSKAAVAVDTESQLIIAVAVLPGNAPDNTGALELVEQSEQNTACEVDETIGDCAYGDGATRQAFVDAGRTLVAKVPGRPNKAYFPKEDFKIDLEAGTCTCLAGQVTRRMSAVTTRTDSSGRTHRAQGFRFHGATCGKCQLRAACVAAGKGKGRTITLHPQEALLQQARLFQGSDAFGEYRKRRQVAEHRLARLMQLGIRQARYFGRVKAHFQLLLAATVANLTLVATRVGMMGKATQQVTSHFAAFYYGVLTVATALFALSRLTVVLMMTVRSIRLPAVSNRGFPARFLV